MTFNCRFETPCGFCEKFERPCKEVCGIDKNDRFKMYDHITITTNPMDSVRIVPLTMGFENGCR